MKISPLEFQLFFVPLPFSKSILSLPAQLQNKPNPRRMTLAHFSQASTLPKVGMGLGLASKFDA